MKASKILRVDNPKVQLFGLSPKAEEVRRIYRANALRDNKTTELHAHPTSLGDKVSPNAIRGGKVINPKRPDQAAPVNRVAITPPGPYKSGDGDFPTALRPGCDDHKQYKSLSTAGTTTYARGHV